MYLSYSGYKIAYECLYRYWHMYINVTKPAKPDDRLGSIFGTTIGALFEAFYQEKLWRHKNVQEILQSRAKRYVVDAIKEATTATDWRAAGIIDWKDDVTNPRGIYYNVEELIEDVRHAVPRGLETIRSNALLGKDAVAEMYLNTPVGDHTFGGRADFVMTLHKTGERVILDGKGSRSLDKDRYTDPTQLLWYSLLLWEKHQEFPDWTGFVYWKKDPPHNVTKHVFSKGDAENLKRGVLAIMKTIEDGQDRLPSSEKVTLDIVQEQFPPKPTESNCRFCPYAADGVCDSGAETVRKMKKRYEKR